MTAGLSDEMLFSSIFSDAVTQLTGPSFPISQPSQTHSVAVGSSANENATINPADLSLPSTLTYNGYPAACLSAHGQDGSTCVPRNSFGEVPDASGGIAVTTNDLMPCDPRGNPGSDSPRLIFLACPICSRSFHRRDQLRRHVKLCHANEKPFQRTHRSERSDGNDVLLLHKAKLRKPSASKPDAPTPQHSGSRFALSAVKALDDWLAAHRENPYPNSDERDYLVRKSGLTPKQVNTWLANARRRQLGPMARYVSSSSEDEAASIEDIRLAAKSMPVFEDIHRTSSYSSFSEYIPYPGLPDYSFSSTGNLIDSPWSPPQPADFGGLSSASSVSSAFDQWPDARWSAPSRKGRKKYAGSIYSSCSSAASLASVDLSQQTLPPPSALVSNYIPEAPKSMSGQLSSKFSPAKKHGCNLCGKRFTRPSSLLTHNYSHTGEKRKLPRYHHDISADGADTHAQHSRARSKAVGATSLL